MGKEVGWFLGSDDENVDQMDKNMLEKLSIENFEMAAVTRHMSINEVAWQKWHKCITSVIDNVSRKVILTHEGHGKTIYYNFCQRV